jgi:hypothetical protein
MSQPYRCPMCAGQKTVRAREGTASVNVPCSLCKGNGVLWSETVSVEPKALDVTSSKDLPTDDSELKTFGDPDAWRLICKVSIAKQHWMKSTKAMEIEGVGCLVQVTTQQGDHVAEAVTFVPCVAIEETNGVRKLVPNAMTRFALTHGQAAMDQLNDSEMAPYLPAGKKS